MNIEIIEVAKICDLTIELIQKVDNAINHKFGDINNWLVRRENTGFFPGEVFT